MLKSKISTAKITKENAKNAEKGDILNLSELCEILNTLRLTNF